MGRGREPSGIAFSEGLVSVGDVGELVHFFFIHEHGNTDAADRGVTPAMVVDTTELVDVVEKSFILLGDPHATV